MEKTRSKKGPLSRSTSIQVTDMDHPEKNKSDKKKHSPARTTTKNGKTEAQVHVATRRKSTNDVRSLSPNKSDVKKHTAASTHTTETTKSHGKTAVLSRSDSHAKATAHGTTKKSRTNKKTEHDKNDRENHKQTEKSDAKITTAVSENLINDKSEANENENES